MKLILIIIGILLILFSSSFEGFAEVDERIFNEIEIPDASTDPYYNFIKNIDWICMCGEGKEKNSKNECVPICPVGQTRFTDDKCYPPCPTGESRHTNTICYPPCPLGDFRNPEGVCQCIPQAPTYDLSINSDITGSDLGECIKNPGGGWPKWADDAKKRCDNNPNCRAYNIIHRGGAWGDDWGSCMKKTSNIPISGANKIDYYRKIDTIKNNNGVCVTECPKDKSRDINGICQWNSCPIDQTRDANGVCQWNSCPVDQTRDANGVCQCIQQPYYEKYINKDISGNDITCYHQPSNLEGCKLNCNNNPNCKAYNIINQGGVWGQDWGCCLKTTSDIPTADANKIDYYRKVTGTLVKESDGICRPPCLINQTRDSNGVCKWNPCPDNSTLNEITGECSCNSGYEVGYWTNANPSLAGQTNVSRNQKCLLKCSTGVTRDMNLVCGGTTTLNINMSGITGSCPPGRFKDITGRCI